MSDYSKLIKALDEIGIKYNTPSLREQMAATWIQIESESDCIEIHFSHTDHKYIETL